jgi:hypothetical protein
VDEADSWTELLGVCEELAVSEGERESEGVTLPGAEAEELVVAVALTEAEDEGVPDSAALALAESEALAEALEELEKG